MPLEDLIPLGYEVWRTPEGAPPGDSVSGYGRQWRLMPGSDEEAIVTQAQNHKVLYDKMTQAQGYFADNYANWPNMNAGQKDAANRQAQRALTNLIRYVRNDLTSEGS